MSRSGENADAAPWFKSSYPTSSQGCVEVALAAGAARVRDSRQPSSGFHTFGSDRWRSFLASLGSGAPWFKSSYSSNSVGCVEVSLGSDQTRVRDSKQPEAGTLHIDRQRWRSFISSLQQR